MKAFSRPKFDSSAQEGSATINPFTKLQTVVGGAMLAISGAGLVYHGFDLAWGIEQQILYATIGGLFAWRHVR